MPIPKKGERKKKFIKRCIPYMFENEPETLTSKEKKSKQAYAICNSIFDRRKKKNENIVFFEDFNENVDFEDWDEEETKEFKYKKFKGILDIGDRIYHNIYGKGTILRKRGSNYYVNFDDRLPDIIMNNNEMNRATGYGCPYGHGWFVSEYSTIYKIRRLGR